MVEAPEVGAGVVLQLLQIGVRGRPKVKTWALKVEVDFSAPTKFRVAASGAEAGAVAASRAEAGAVAASRVAVGVVAASEAEVRGGVARVAEA